jgi:SHAQKYF class myb-like DNA-binding protein
MADQSRVSTEIHPAAPYALLTVTVLQAWTNDEHKRFLEALEQYGNGTTGSEWQLMAEYVGSRSYNEIKLHAHKYFLKLQSATAKKTPKAGSRDAGKDWTHEENKIFENSLATIDEGGSLCSLLICFLRCAGTGEDRWEKISAAISGKTAEDVKLRSVLRNWSVLPCASYKLKLVWSVTTLGTRSCCMTWHG